jgi:hypothetical protein
VERWDRFDQKGGGFEGFVAEESRLLMPLIQRLSSGKKASPLAIPPGSTSWSRRTKTPVADRERKRQSFFDFFAACPKLQTYMP